VVDPEQHARIELSDPFADPPGARDPVRRLRARLAAPVTIWTAGADRERTGLTVSSVLVAAGEPAHVLGLVSPDSDLWDVVQQTGRLVLHVLGWEHRDLADAFAGLRPYPGGLFRDVACTETGYGPEITAITTRARCRLIDGRPVGYGVLVQASIDEVAAGELDQPLLHTRGRYGTVAGR
jgi:3-hydroxy-9,10-secoandrosta-1,3,5(10)-triene-9,17-dione monooxygenase reductase component